MPHRRNFPEQYFELADRLIPDARGARSAACPHGHSATSGILPCLPSTSLSLGTGFKSRRVQNQLHYVDWVVMPRLNAWVSPRLIIRVFLPHPEPKLPSLFSLL